MADRKISELDAVTDVQDTDDFVLARAGASKRITGLSLASELGGSSSGLPDWITTQDSPPIIFIEGEMKPKATGGANAITIESRPITDPPGSDQVVTLYDWDADENVFWISPTGAVTISPSEEEQIALDIHHPGALADGWTILNLQNAEAHDVFWVDTEGSVLHELQDSGAVFNVRTLDGGGLNLLRVEGDRQIGFFGASPVTQQAEPTTINEVVAALQAYGLSA